jgi:hypothetical protein
MFLRARSATLKARSAISPTVRQSSSYQDRIAATWSAIAAMMTGQGWQEGTEVDGILRSTRIPHTCEAAAQNSLKLIGRVIVGFAASVLVFGCFGWAVLGPGEGFAQAQPIRPVPADDNDWGPPHHWCPGQLPVPDTGNSVTDPLRWDWHVCHTYYFVYQGMGNVSKVVWDGDNPPPKPPPPIGLYCDPVTLTNCRIGSHP